MHSFIGSFFSVLLSVVVLALPGSFLPGQLASASQCSDEMINPISDITWNCIFPISIGGMIQIGESRFDDDDDIGDSICVCGSGLSTTVGLTVQFWEPARIIDTVRKPYCFNALGMQISNPAPGHMGGAVEQGTGSTQRLFQQMHYYRFPAWTILDIFTDLPCMEEGGFDVMMISEVIPTWNNEILALLLNPEAVLFANPIAQIACAADAAKAADGDPIDTLFWCLGSWGNAYPLAGHVTSNDMVEGNAAIAAKAIYMMGRTGLLRDPGVDECGSVYTPIWNKSHYRLQLMKPVRDTTCRGIGESGMLWTQQKNPPLESGNYSWMAFRKVKCCVGYSF